MRLALSLILLSSVAAKADDVAKADLNRFEKQLKAASATVGPSLVCVVASRSDQYPKAVGESWRLGSFDRAEFLKVNPKKATLADRLDLASPEAIPDHGFAGGVIVDASGLVLVPYHTIEGATKIYVHLAGGGGSYADLRAADARSDLAVLKLVDPPKDLKPIRFGTVRLNPTDDSKPTVSTNSVGLLMALSFTAEVAFDRPKSGLATISQIRRPEYKGEAGTRFASLYNYAPLLEYESQFHPGASGAALLNLDGELIGLGTTTAAVPTGDSGHGFALPLDVYLTRVIEHLRRGEEVEYGFLGVQQLRDQGGLPGRGIFVQDLAGRSSPAALAGVNPGETIYKINGVKVSSFEDLLLHVGHTLAGNEITMEVGNAGRTRKVPVTLAKFKSEVPFVASVRPEPVFGLRVEYGSVLLQMQFNPFFGQRGYTDVPAGVLVRDLIPDSPAAAKFKQLGDTTRWVVTQVDGRAVGVPADFYKEAAGKKSVTLKVVDANDSFGNVREVKLP